tara:strand:+ start:2370 stop:2594 length:225 start_codon:yes stop_codon:yes gene_type:complete
MRTLKVEFDLSWDSTEITSWVNEHNDGLSKEDRVSRRIIVEELTPDNFRSYICWADYPEDISIEGFLEYIVEDL